MVGLAIFGVVFSMSQRGSLMFLLESFSRTFTVFLILAVVVRSFEDVRRLLGAFAVGAAVFGVMAPVSRGGPGGSVGAGGYDPNDAAMFLVSGLPCLVFFVLHGRSLAVRIAAGLGGFAVLGTIATTSSRGGFIGVVAVLAFMLFMLKGVKPMLRIGVVCAVALAGVTVASSDYWERMQTISEFDDGYGTSEVGGRRNTWGRAIDYAVANPLTGIGINQFWRGEANHPLIRARIEAGRGTKYNAAHSMWFQVVAELGFPGLFAFVALFILSFRQLRRLQRSGLDPPAPLNRAEVQAMASCAHGVTRRHHGSRILLDARVLIAGLGTNRDRRRTEQGQRYVGPT
jgi:hypothetical protein